MVHDVLLNPGAVDAVLQANLLAHGASASTGDSEVTWRSKLPDGSVGAQDATSQNYPSSSLLEGLWLSRKWSGRVGGC